VLQLLSPRKSIRASAARAFLGRLVGAARLTEQQTAAPVDLDVDQVPAEDLPGLDEIEAAAAEYERAADQARRADRGKRAARKILDRVPTGRWGGWLVERVPSGRQTADLDEIRRIFKAHNLGPVPMKPAMPSLKVSRAVDTAPDAGLAEAELLALASAR
jgi:hypothetical protein